jgi:excinuclease ABC subunit B
MQKTIDETIIDERNKSISIRLTNRHLKHWIKIESAFIKNSGRIWISLTLNTAAEPETEYLSKPELEKIIRENENQWKSKRLRLHASKITILKITGTTP